MEVCPTCRGFFAWAGNRFPHSVVDAVIQQTGGKPSQRGPRRLVDAALLCRAARLADAGVLSPDHPWTPDVCLPGLRPFFLPDSLSSARKFLARRVAAVEPVEQLRHPLPGAMEYPGALSAGLVLSAVSALLVAGGVLPVAPVLGRAGHVFARPPLDAKPPGRRLCRNRFRLQRTHVQQPDVAGDGGRAGLDAVGGVAHRTRMARRGPDARARGGR